MSTIDELYKKYLRITVGETAAAATLTLAEVLMTMDVELVEAEPAPAKPAEVSVKVSVNGQELVQDEPQALPLLTPAVPGTKLEKLFATAFELQPTTPESRSSD